MQNLKVLVLLSAGLLLAGPVLAAGDAAAGKGKAESCADCHGDDGKGDKDNPSIAGMAPAEFIKGIKDYQSGARTKSPKMAKSAKKTKDEDLDDLAAYFASLPK